MLILPQGSQKPGPGASINWDHPLARGLLMCIPFNEGIWNTTDATNKYIPWTIWGAAAPRHPSIASGTIDWISNSQGRGIVNTTQASHVGAWTDFIPLSGVTIAVIRRLLTAAVPTGTGGALFLDQTAVAGERVGAFAPYIDGTLYWSFGGTSAPNTLTIASLPLTTTIDKFVFTAGRTGLAVWRNGVKIGSSATAVTRSSLSASVFLNGGANAGAIQEINFLWIVNYPWSADLCQWWMAEPYDAMLSPSDMGPFLDIGRQQGGQTWILVRR